MPGRATGNSRKFPGRRRETSGRSTSSNFANRLPLPRSITPAPRRLHLVALNLDLIFVPTRLGQVVDGLPVQPEFSVAPSRLLQPNGHLRREDRMAVQYPPKPALGNTQHLGRFGDVQTEQVHTVLLDAATGVREILHSDSFGGIPMITISQTISFKPAFGTHRQPFPR